MGRCEGAILLLQFCKQPYILNRDDRLVGEGLEQGDLPLAEEASLGAAEHDRAGRDTFSHQGDAEYRPPALTPCVHAALGKFIALALRVSEVECPCLEHRPACDGPADDREDGRGNRAVVGDETEVLALLAPDGGVE